MLTKLRITNFALIDQLHLQFSPGLNIVTGETGTGKSILMETLLAILGSRLSADAIRSGCDSCRLEATLEIDARGEALLEQWGMEPSEAGTIVISRRYQSNGKNTIHINGCAATLTQLRQLGALIADVHGQNEQLSLFRPEVLRSLLDHFCGPEHLQTLRDYGTVYDAWQELLTLMEDRQNQKEQQRLRLNGLRWEAEEIGQANLRAGEEAEGRQQLQRLLNTERLRTTVQTVRQYLEGDEDDSSGAVNLTASALRELSQIRALDDALANYADALQEAYYSLKEIGPELRGYQEMLEADPEQIVALQQRLDLLDKLKRKYGATVEEVIAHGQTTAAEILRLEREETAAESYAVQEQELRQQVTALTSQLHDCRQAGARELANKLESILRKMGMEHTRIILEVACRERLERHGGDAITMLFSANAGETPRPLQEVISGGELSRLALAVKSITADELAARLQVFDEIDAGIGGMTAKRIAEHLAVLARQRQIICITHLPQIAAMADQHFSVRKRSDGNMTTTQVLALGPAEQLEEIVRMTAGNEPTPVLLEGARHILDQAQAFKQQLVDHTQ